MARQCSAFRNALLLGALTALTALPAQAASLRYCDAHTEVDAAVQDRLIQVAGIVKTELDRSGQSVALVARSGLALERFDQPAAWRVPIAAILVSVDGKTWGDPLPGRDR